MSNSSNIPLGCTVAILSSATQSIGLILQRKSHLLSQRNASSLYNKSLWHIGFLMFLVANLVGSSIQLSALPILVLTPLQSIGLLFNTIFHSLLLNEPFTYQSLYASIFISTGAMGIAYCGAQLPEQDYTLKQFVTLLKADAFINWLLCNLLIISLIVLWIYLLYKQINHKSVAALSLRCENHVSALKNALQRHLESLNSSGIIFYCQLYNYKFSIKTYKYSLFLLNLVFNHSNSKLFKFLGISLGIISGILSAHSLLLAKSSIEILISTFINHEWKTLNSPITYLIVIVFIVLGISQLYLLNLALKNISTSVLYPLVFCIYNIFSISNSLIFFDQWLNLELITCLILLFGTALVIIGVFILSFQQHDEINDIESSFNKSYGSINNNSFNDEDNTSIDDSVSVSSTDLVVPLLKRTTNNLNNAGRKVSGLIKKSMDSFNNTDNANNSNANNHTNNINVPKNELRGYVSFDSLKLDTNDSLIPPNSLDEVPSILNQFSPVKKHKRNFSFEQNELFNELNT